MVFPIPPDISYGLQCSEETLDITPDVGTFFYRFNNEYDLTAQMDRNETLDRPRRSIRDSLWRSSRLDYVSPYRDWFHHRATPRQQTWCIAGACERVGRLTAETIEFYYKQMISDALEKGLDPSRRSVQSRYIAESSEMRKTRKSLSGLWQRLGLIDPEELRSALLEPRRYQLLVEDFGQAEFTDMDLLPIPVLSRREIKQRERASRKVLRKSANFLTRLIGQPQTSILLAGGRIEVVGEEFTFSVRKRNLESLDHGALSISVLERHSGDRLFDLCWYVEKTPALDQISAMILAVQTGNEREIIEIGNALSVDHAALARHDDIRIQLGYEPHPEAALSDMPEVVLSDMPVLIRQGLSEMIAGRFLPDDDTLMRLTPGTTAYAYEHASTYIDFSRRAARSFTRSLPQRWVPIFAPHEPHTIRQIDGERVGRGLLEPREQNNYQALLT